MIFVIFKNGEYFGTALDYEAAYRDVSDNISHGWIEAEWEPYTIEQFVSCGEEPKPRAR